MRARVSGSSRGAPSEISRSMRGGNQGRSSAICTMPAMKAAMRWSAGTGRSAISATRSADGAEHVADDLAVEGELVGEVVVDHRLVEASGVGDVVDADAVEAAGGEELGGGVEDVFARVAEGGAPGSGTGCCHESLTNHLF